MLSITVFCWTTSYHDWFSIYLSNRFQSALYNNFESDYKEIKCGVSQGSILVPLLFLIYINDLPSVSKFFLPILFADDTNLFCTGKNLSDIVKEINVELDKIYSWVKANKLSLNVDKTNFMLFTPKCSQRNMDDLLINGIRISEVSDTKFLGVIIDDKLNWSSAKKTGTSAKKLVHQQKKTGTKNWYISKKLVHQQKNCKGHWHYPEGKKRF